MDDSFENSVTAWIDEMREGEDEAAAKLWQRYFERMTHVARKKLGPMARRASDEEDVALSVFDSLCRGVGEGRFAAIGSRDELWRLLVAMTARKAVDLIRRESRQKRGSGTVRGHSIFQGTASEIPGGFDQVLSSEPTPEFLVMLEDEYEHLFARLRDETLRQIVSHRLEGYPNAEIAAKLGISLRSVERKLRLIREEWSQEIGQ